MLQLQPISQKEAFAFIKKYHRHHGSPRGWKFGIGVNDGEKVVGVLVAGRPVARRFDDGYTVEVTRCCTNGMVNACSMLYGAAWRAAKALGYRRLITYTLKSEPGTSLVASGWRLLGETRGGSWNRGCRPRVDTHPTEQKQLWEAV